MQENKHLLMKIAKELRSTTLSSQRFTSAA